MTDRSQQISVSLIERINLLGTFPCFQSLTPEQNEELARLMQEVCYARGDRIVVENDLVDSVYIIVSGEAEVTRAVQERKKIIQLPLAVLAYGEGIGLQDTGFYSTTGKRTATVTAITEMLLLRLDIRDLYGFLKSHNLEHSMYSASEKMLRMRFIKQSLPFAKLSVERLRWLSEHVEDVNVNAGTIIFNQGDPGDKCYLIRSGQVEILAEDESGQERKLALLTPPVLFGEATLITHAPRNATAKAATDCELMMIKAENLSELIESEANVAQMFMSLMIDRSRPVRNENITAHSRTTADGQTITILKNPENSSYFKLSEEGAFIWEQFDGEHTVQDITLNLAEQFNVFAPDVIAGLVSKLSRTGFISNLDLHDDTRLAAKPLWIRAITRLRRIMEVRVAFGDADAWISRIYKNYIRYFFTKPAQIMLALFAAFGLFAFVENTTDILLFFNSKHASLWLLLALIPFSLVAVMLHELGHAFAVKSCGREVHYMGVGWHWFMPIAFTDTSDMWLASRKSRMYVNLAGVYMDVMIAGFSAMLIFVIDNPYIDGMLWLFSLYTYISAIRMLSPLQELDGYYVLMDWLEKPKLRHSAVQWLVKKFPRSLMQRKLVRENKAEISYWIACILYLIVITILTLVLQTFVFGIFELKPANPWISLLLPFCVVIFSSFGIIADIKNQTEE